MPNAIQKKKIGMLAKGGMPKQFEKSGKDKDSVPFFKKFGKEGSKSEEKADVKQSRFASGGLMRGTGAATRGKGFSGCK